MQRLREAEEWVGHARNSATATDPQRVEKYLQQALAALSAAMQHTLFLTMLGDLRTAHVGESRSLADYCSGWGLSAAQVDNLWAWLTNDALAFGGEDLPVALDSKNHLVYRLADSQPLRWLPASAPILGFGLVFGVVGILDDIPHDQQMIDNEVLVPFENDTMLTINSPIWVDGSQKVKPRKPPGIGEHSDEILRAAGDDEAAIRELRASGAVA